MSSVNDIYGLVLAGGQSTRMGKDKGEIQYHKFNHRTHLYHILSKFCSKTFISCRADQQNIVTAGSDYIQDENLYNGPLNGILSAHHAYPDKAWLIVAVDLPHVNDNTIFHLIKNRNKNKHATVYATLTSKLPEPLIAIWEPKGLESAEKWVRETGKSCPRKFLLNEDIVQVFPENDIELFNANYPQDYKAAKGRIEQAIK